MSSKFELPPSDPKPVIVNYLSGVEVGGLAKDAFHLLCPSTYGHVEDFLSEFDNNSTENTWIDLHGRKKFVGSNVSIPVTRKRSPLFK